MFLLDRFSNPLKLPIPNRFPILVFGKFLRLCILKPKLEQDKFGDWHIEFSPLLEWSMEYECALKEALPAPDTKI